MLSKDRSSVILVLRDDIVNDVSEHVGQSLFSPLVKVAQAFMIKSHQMQDCRVDVVHMGSVLNGLKPQFICGSIAGSAFHAPTGHPHAEAVRVVIPTRSVFALAEWHASEFTAPDDEC